MLQRVFPAGTVLRDVGIEVSGRTSFGRQMGSYPILVGFPLALPAGAVTDAVVVGWGMRSITALPAPIEINTLPHAAIGHIPGIGKKILPKVLAKRPFADLAAFRKVAGETPLDDYFSF